MGNRLDWSTMGGTTLVQPGMGMQEGWDFIIVIIVVSCHRRHNIHNIFLAIITIIQSLGYDRTSSLSSDVRVGIFIKPYRNNHI